MKRMKRFSAVVIAGMLVLPIAGKAFAAQTDSSGDFAGSGLYQHYVDSDYEVGTAEGVGKGTAVKVSQKADPVYTYKDDGNLLKNPGFEKSTTAQNVSRAWQEVTAGWMPDYESKSNMFDFGLSGDAHSGEKAFSVTVKGRERYIRLFSTNVNTKSTTPLAGVYENLEPDTEYIASFWAKGTSVARVFGKTKTRGDEWGTPYNLKPEEWTLVTKECTSYDTGAYWWNVYLKGDADQYAVIDDIQLVTREQAIQNVEAMIDGLDVTAGNAARAIDDIRQWCAVLKPENISNYEVFLNKISGKYQYKDTGNMLANPGFEQSTTAQNVGDAWKEVTKGWMSSDPVSSAKYSLALPEDAHSGAKAFSVTFRAAATEIRLFNANANQESTEPQGGAYEGLEPNTKYIASFWAKGTSEARIFGKGKVKTDNHWGTKCELNPEKWVLVTKECTSYDTGAYWWNVHLQGDADQYAIIDDIQLVTRKQAIQNVAAMINELDVTADNAVRAIDDISQWCKALGSEQISNYALFESKMRQYDAIQAGVANIFTLTEDGLTTNLTEGDVYIASVWLKGDGKVNLLAGATQAESLKQKTEILLTEDWTIHTFDVTAGAEGSIYLGLQLSDPDEENNHTVKYIDKVALRKSTTGDSGRRNTWNLRAKELLNTENATFIAGLNDFKAALLDLRTAERMDDDTTVIAGLRAAWNELQYTLGGDAITPSLFEYGDVNVDQVVDVRDLVKAKKYLANDETAIANISEYARDMDDNNVFNNDDIVAVRHLLVVQ